MRNWAKGYAADNYEPKDGRTGGGGGLEDSITSMDDSVPPSSIDVRTSCNWSGSDL